MPRGDLARQLELHPFLQLDEEQRSISIRAGVWDVPEPLIIPVGYSLLVDAGVTLRFAAEAALIAHGTVRFEVSRPQPFSSAVAE